MTRLFSSFATGSALAAAMLVLPTLNARAAGPYDGTWILDIPAEFHGAAKTIDAACPAVRVRFEVSDSHISGMLKRPADGEAGVANSDAPDAVPVSGSVRPDGAMVANWGSYGATGSLAGSTPEVTVASSCGPRTGTAIRVQ